MNTPTEIDRRKREEAYSKEEFWVTSTLPLIT